jgi:heme/copper-type cytochrome/quinol oxidase subunit 2
MINFNEHNTQYFKDRNNQNSNQTLTIVLSVIFSIVAIVVIALCIYLLIEYRRLKTQIYRSNFALAHTNTY